MYNLYVEANLVTEAKKKTVMVDTCNKKDNGREQENNLIIS